MEEDKRTGLVSLDDVDNDMARKRLEDLLKESHVLGVMIWGSKATGFGATDTDWDALIYVTDSYYESLDIMDTIWLEYDESVEPKKLVIDFSPISDAWFEQQLDSPLDIDHFPYVEGVVLYDPSGQLEDWRQKLARYPEEEHSDRLKNKFFLMRGSFGSGFIDDKRGFDIDARLNLFRSVVAGVNLWFTIKRSWTPPLKWWSKWAKRMGMTDETYQKFCTAIEDTTVDNVRELVSHLSEMIVDEGFEFPKDALRTFLETIHTAGRPMQIRHSYL
ncbi:MAG: DUF4037 domain-containing protein [Candidatus Thorarchaeota archaeon]|jgi:predicted nucleotidyltransferase